MTIMYEGTDGPDKLAANNVFPYTELVIMNGYGGDDELKGAFLHANEIHGGSGNDIIIGGASSNKLYGADGDDSLDSWQGEYSEIFGGTGNDILRGGNKGNIIDGGQGDDQLFGGDGADIYVVDSIYDTIKELYQPYYDNDPNPRDTVRSSVDWILGVHLEDLTLTGALPINATGNLLANTLIGNTASNRLDGGGGNDTLIGGEGDDTLIGGDGIDTLDGGEGDDTLSAGAGSALAGGVGNDILQVTTSGTLWGGGGNDFITCVSVFFGPTIGFVIDGGDGNDTIRLPGLHAGGRNPLILGSGAVITSGAGSDRISAFARIEVTDFLAGTGGDILDLDPFTQGWIGSRPDALQRGDVTAEQVGANVVFTSVAFGAVVTLRNVAVLNLAASNFSYFGSDGPPTGVLRFGDQSADVLEGGSDVDWLFGSTGDDELRGGAGADTLRGEAGDDLLIGGPGADALSGGAGIDTASYRTAFAGVTASLSAPAGNAGDAAGDTYFEYVSYGFIPQTGVLIENLEGSAFADQLTGDGGANQLVGLEGDDTLDGLGGHDLLIGGSGNDTLIGGGGEDRLMGGPGADRLDGTLGYTYTSYADAASGVSAYLTWEAGNSGDAAGDKFIAVEGLIGSSFADVLSGDAGENTMDGGDGNDWVFGREGQDALLGGAGNDVLSGGGGSTVNNHGGDLLDGGDGVDVAYYRDAPNTVFLVSQVGNKLGMLDGHSYGVSIDIANGANNFGEAMGDVLVNIENIWGSRFDDIIRGDDGVGGQIYGFEGNDILEGRGGDDVFYGSTGADTLTGGAGAEDFFYLSYNDHYNQYGTLEAYEGGDTITDFEHGVDHITVSRYWFGFGNIGGPAAALTDQYADFITSGSAAATTKPTFFWNAATGVLLFDPDGSGASEAVNIATLINGPPLTLSDIWTA